MPPTRHDHDALAPAIARGDAEAFAAWLAFGEPIVRRSLTSFAARVDVEAVIQETLLRLWQVAPRFVPDGEVNGLLRLALRIGRNLAISEVRRLHGVAASLEDAERELPVDTGADARPDPLLRAAIVDCSERLPERPKLALHARCESAGADDDKTLAARLGMTLNTFLQNFTRARRMLAECLEQRGVELPGGLGR